MKKLLSISLFSLALIGYATPPKQEVHVKATVKVGFDVDNHGVPQHVEVVSWTGPASKKKEIEDAAIKATKRWILKPEFYGRHVILPFAFDIEGDAPATEIKNDPQEKKG